MVWLVANFLLTSRQLVGRVGRVEFGERHDKQTNEQQTAGRPIILQSVRWMALRRNCNVFIFVFSDIQHYFRSAITLFL